MNMDEIRNKVGTLLRHVEEYELLPPNSIDINKDDDTIDANWHLTHDPDEARKVIRSFGAQTWVPHEASRGDMYFTRLHDGGQITVWAPEGTVGLKVVLDP